MVGILEIIKKIIVDAMIYDCDIRVETQVIPKNHIFGNKEYTSVIIDASDILEFLIDNEIYGENIMVTTGFNRRFILDRNNIFTSIQRIVSIRDFAITVINSANKQIPKQEKGMFSSNGKEVLESMEIIKTQAEFIKELTGELLKDR